MPFDDFLDVVRRFLVVVPVDEAWYCAEYPEVASALLGAVDETAAIHFRKHGYVTHRQPYAPGWNGLRQPVPFLEVTKGFKFVASRGDLYVETDRQRFLERLVRLLECVPVDSDWYRATYPSAAHDIDAGRFASAADHYLRAGYFEDLLPFDIVVDEAWYVSRYRHVRTGLELGEAASPRDHFIRIGYNEGCQPARESC
nr:hypothetical protein [uncultured Rhodopila sp.]